MSLPKTYTEIAEKVGVYRWPGFTGTNRRVTRSGIRRFLMASYYWEPRTDKTPEWLKLWYQIQWVRHQARYTLHVVIPPELWAEDKARLAARMTNDQPPYGGNDPYEEERTRALRWARR